jgi:hypothetical protein
MRDMGWITATMQVARDLLSLPKPMQLDLAPLQTFDTAPQPIDKLLAAMRSGSGPVSRIDAMSVAAVERARNELCAIATIPLRLYTGLAPVDAPLFRQFDLDVPNVVHMAQTIEDLVLDQVAWWQVVGTDFDGYPMAVRRIDPSRVQLTRPDGPARAGDERYVWIRRVSPAIGWDVWPANLMKRFDSPNPGLLKTCAREIRILAQLDRLIEMYANNPSLRDLFTANLEAPVEMYSDDEVTAFLAEWTALRQVSPAAYLPPALKKADVTMPSPRDLTLVELRDALTLSIANRTGVDPEDLGVSTTSRTYFNGVDRRQEKINRVYSPYMKAITDRLLMSDMTRRGYLPAFDLSDYLKSDPNTQAAYWGALKGMGVVDEMWIGEQAGIDPAVTRRAMRAVPAAPAVPADAGLNARRPALQFADDRPAFIFDARDFGTAAAPTVDQTARTITGLAVPYGATAQKYGMKITFEPGSLEYGDPARMPHLQDHAVPVGFHRSIRDTKDGPVVELAVLDAPEGSRAKEERDLLLHDAANGLYSGLSIGVDYSLDPEDGDVTIDDDGVVHVQRATWRETSSTYMPAFDDARVTRVAASLTGRTTVEPCQHCGHRHAPGIACRTFVSQLLSQPGPAPQPNPAPAPQPDPAPAPQPEPPNADVFAAFARSMGMQVSPLGLMAPPAPGPTTVNLHHGGVATVREPLPYRYDRRGNLGAGAHDFSTDITIAHNPKYDGPEDRTAAARRIEGWLSYAFGGDDGQQHLGRLATPGDAVSQQFAITPANVVNLNYPQNHPEMYVDQLEYLYPMYQEFNKGTLDTVTPFVLPKFSSSSGLVADHVSGTEPTPGAFAATAQTITPSALSGKVEMLREVFDQGGNPQASGLIWRQMVRGWYEGVEAAIQAFFVANAASITDIALGTAVTDAAMDTSLATFIASLQYIRGGDRFRKIFTQTDLYNKLLNAKDTTNRPLYPPLGAMNAAGQAGPEANYINVRGKLFVPAWATAATGSVVQSSWMMDPDVVGVWVSVPKRIDLEWRVAWVDIGIWGYKALGIVDFTRARELTYDPV